MVLSTLFSSFFSVLVNILSKLEICWFEGLVGSSSMVKQSRSGCLKALLCSPLCSLLAGHFETWKPWLHNKSLNSRLQESLNCVERFAFVSTKFAVGTSCVMNHYKHFACTQAERRNNMRSLFSTLVKKDHFIAGFPLLCSDFMQNFQHSHNWNDHKWYKTIAWGRHEVAMFKSDAKWKKLWRKGGERCSQTRADIGTYCHCWQYLIAKYKQFHLKLFFSLCAVYIDL